MKKLNELTEKAKNLAESLPAVHAEIILQLIEECQALSLQNTAMIEAIAFATAPDLWIQRDENIWEYRHPGREWYGDVLKQAMKKGADHV